jgi:hypothetical protein
VQKDIKQRFMTYESQKEAYGDSREVLHIQRSTRDKTMTNLKSKLKVKLKTVLTHSADM